MPFSEVIRGDENRQWLVENYHLKCTGHFDIFNDEDNLKCCCNDPLGLEYFRFVATSKYDPKEVNIFYAGPSCGRKINRLADLDAPEKIGFYAAEAAQANRNTGVNENRPQIPTPINVEIKQVCFLTQCLMGKCFRKFLDGLLERTTKNPERTPTDSEITVLNEITGEWARKVKKPNGEPCTTLREAIAVRAARPGHRLRVFNFPRLESRLVKIDGGIASMF